MKFHPQSIQGVFVIEPEPLGVEWPQFAHSRRPEFLQTLPHIHGTSGFFVARLRVPVTPLPAVVSGHGLE